MDYKEQKRKPIIANSELKNRVLTSLWGIPLAVTAVWFDRPVPWFTVLVAAWGVVGVYEFYRLVSATKVKPLTSFGLVWTLLFILSPYFNRTLATPLLLTLSAMLPLIWLLSRPQKEGAFLRWAWTIAGIIYVGWLLSYLVELRGLNAGRDWVLFALLTTFASDTSAYFGGRAFGRRRLAPSISPGKTWEGAIFGVMGALVASLVLANLLRIPLSYGQAIFLGIAISISGQFGDLIESLFKRNTGAKDSGKLLPGHGGVLDRMDSIIFAGIVVYYFVLALNKGWLNWLG